MVSIASIQYGDKNNGNRLGKGGSSVGTPPIIKGKGLPPAGEGKPLKGKVEWDYSTGMSLLTFLQPTMA